MMDKRKIVSRSSGDVIATTTLSVMASTTTMEAVVQTDGSDIVLSIRRSVDDRSALGATITLSAAQARTLAQRLTDAAV